MTKLILHIGMGKTGTTSIQNVLRTGTEQLKAQKVHYLGMWFDEIDPKFHGISGEQTFFQLDFASQETAAVAFAKVMREKQTQNDVETFIFSNEAIFQQVSAISPFLLKLRTMVDLWIVAYIRDPHAWLPSAYVQWELRHKTHPGPLRSFNVQARRLITMYDSYPVWQDLFGDIMKVRLHDTGTDVVQDFAAVCGITLDQEKTRHLARNEDAEILLRAAFNNRIQASTLPTRFNAEILDPPKGVPSLSDLARFCFENEGTATIVSERRALFERMRDELGPDFDFISGQSPNRKPHDMEATHKRLMDYLVEITFLQAERIKNIENQMLELRKDQ